MTLASTIGIRQKILFGMVGAVLAALLPTFFAVDRWLAQSVNRRVAEDFARAERTFARVQQMRASLLIWEGLAFAKSPQLFAAVETGDPATVQDVLLSEIPDVATRDLYLVVGIAGEILAGDGAGAAAAASLRPLLENALAGRTGAGAVALDGEIFEAAAAPILVGDRAVGALIVGNRVSAPLLENLRVILGNEVALRAGDRIRLSSLPAGAVADLESALADGRLPAPAAPGAASRYGGTDDALRLGDERYLCSSIALASVDGAPIADFLLLESLDHAMGTAGSLRRALLLVAALAGIVALVVPVAISRGLSADIAELVRGAREVKGGNYEHRVASRARDEIGFLAGVFDEMRVALRERMEEARRLTEDLRAKNVALEEAFARLRATQQELIKSEKLAHTAGLAAQLSHELNNPIYNIQTCVEVLQKRIPPTDRSREFIDLVYDEVRRMTKLTKQMLGFAKPARDEMTPTDLNRVVDDLLRISTRWLEERGIGVELRLADALPRILASADQLRQVLLNLIVNASDAMPGGGRIRIETGVANGSVFAAVEDTGCGIPPENIGKIFDAFFTTKTEMSGVGLGLSISYGIVERHRGRIEVASEVGKGSRFLVTVPAIADRADTGG